MPPSSLSSASLAPPSSTLLHMCYIGWSLIVELELLTEIYQVDLQTSEFINCVKKGLRKF